MAEFCAIFVILLEIKMPYLTLVAFVWVVPQTLSRTQNTQRTLHLQRGCGRVYSRRRCVAGTRRRRVARQHLSQLGEPTLSRRRTLVRATGRLFGAWRVCAFAARLEKTKTKKKTKKILAQYVLNTFVSGTNPEQINDAFVGWRSDSTVYGLNFATPTACTKFIQVFSLSFRARLFALLKRRAARVGHNAGVASYGRAEQSA